MKDLRNEYIQIKLTRAEKQQLKALAEKNHISIATYIRMKCFNTKNK